ncbi:MAG: hypothetical protein HY909_28770 [Deltaproteobacteria bacterium]|nr:hypothetical protein [Deltaproteobacteria bacterium]
MILPVLLLPLFLPVDTAETVPRGVTMLRLTGGVDVLRTTFPSAPVLPLPTGLAELSRGVADGCDLRLRYSTTAGLLHRAGPELRARLLGGSRYAVALRLYPSASFAGATRGEVTYGGDLSTQAMLLGTLRGPFGALTLEAGATGQWLVFERFRGVSEVTTRPYLAFLEFGLGWERPLGPEANLSVRLDLAVTLAPADPFALAGLYPRLSVGGSFRL